MVFGQVSLLQKEKYAYTSLISGVQFLSTEWPQSPLRVLFWQLFKLLRFQQELLILTFSFQPFGSIDIWLVLELTIRRQHLPLLSYNTYWTNFYQIFQNVIMCSQRKDAWELFVEFDISWTQKMRMKKFGHLYYTCGLSFSLNFPLNLFSLVYVTFNWSYIKSKLPNGTETFYMVKPHDGKGKAWIFLLTHYRGLHKTMRNDFLRCSIYSACN